MAGRWSAFRTWAQPSPAGLMRFHFWRGAFWILLSGLAIWRGWIYSVAFISVLSLAALIEAAFSSWAGSRAEVKTEEATKG